MTLSLEVINIKHGLPVLRAGYEVMTADVSAISSLHLQCVLIGVCRLQRQMERRVGLEQSVRRTELGHPFAFSLLPAQMQPCEMSDKCDGIVTSDLVFCCVCPDVIKY